MSTDLHYARALQEFEAGRLRRSLIACNDVLRLDARHFRAMTLRGMSLIRMGRIDEGIESLDQSLAIEVRQPGALNARGVASSQLGRNPQAVDDYDRAIALAPGYADAWHNRGVSLRELQRHVEAVASFDRALALQPDHFAALMHRGMALFALRSLPLALRDFDRSIALEPDNSSAHHNRGLTLNALRRTEAALASLRRALELGPERAEIHDAIGGIHLDAHRHELAETAYAEAVRLEPRNTMTLGSLSLVQRHLCAWAALERTEARIRELLASSDDAAMHPFALLATPGVTGTLQRRSAHRFSVDSCAPDSVPLAVAERRAAASLPLRVGYLTSDVCDHPVARLVVGVLEQHDRDTVTPYGYAIGGIGRDLMAARLQASCSIFRDLTDLADAEAAARIQADRIDVLVDLNGHTAMARSGILAHRPAPILVNWLGYAGTLGHARLADYVIGDPVVTPLAHAEHFSETIAQLPYCYLPPDTTVSFDTQASSREAAGLPAAGLVFYCASRAFKITRAAFAAWCQLLARVDGSVLWLPRPDDVAAVHLHAFARGAGIDPGRIVFAARTPSIEAHIARLGLADLALDTFPYTSHSTAAEVLRAGVPLVTLEGATFVSRVAASVLRSLGLDELVTDSEQGYAQLAYELASDGARLRAQRERVKSAVARSPAVDAARFTRDLEELYRAMTARRGAGEGGPTLAMDAHVDRATAVSRTVSGG
jgi:predicted O-linked N-acetylglucosamine transferase (SPINDLY family)